MSVETEMYVIESAKDDRLEESFSVYPGSFEQTGFLGGNVKLGVFCDADNTKGTVYIQIDGKSREINAVKYRDDEDLEGEDVDINKPIVIKGMESLSVYNYRGQQREAFIFIDLEDDWKNEYPFEIPTESKPLVTV